MSRCDLCNNWGVDDNGFACPRCHGKKQGSSKMETTEATVEECSIVHERLRTASPCPFCGYEEVMLDVSGNYDEPYYAVRCVDCGAQDPQHTHINSVFAGWERG